MDAAVTVEDADAVPYPAAAVAPGHHLALDLRDEYVALGLEIRHVRQPVGHRLAPPDLVRPVDRFDRQEDGAQPIEVGLAAIGPKTKSMQRGGRQDVVRAYHPSSPYFRRM